MKYYIIAGEASGDLHGANLIRALRKQDHDAHCRAWGGDRMAKQGAELVRHINELAFMGFVEVLANIRTILGNIRWCKKDILQYRPDVVIFIDYPGFNLRIARFCKQQGIKTVYYISPQVWAWNRSRVKNIRRDIDKMLVILPFEKDFYRKYAYEVDFVGHPLLDALNQDVAAKPGDVFRQDHNLTNKKIIALLPGSRRQEISRLLPVMAATRKYFPDYQFVIAGTDAHSIDFYKQYMNGENTSVLVGATYELLHNAHAAMVTSGTATLETALIGTPQVVCYKAGALSYHIAKRLVDIPYISLVNLIMEEEVVKELIQHECNVKNLVTEMKGLTENSDLRKNISEKYATLRHKLGGTGASDKAAETITAFLTSK